MDPNQGYGQNYGRYGQPMYNNGYGNYNVNQQQYAPQQPHNTGNGRAYNQSQLQPGAQYQMGQPQYSQPLYQNHQPSPTFSSSMQSSPVYNHPMVMVPQRTPNQPPHSPQLNSQPTRQANYGQYNQAQSYSQPQYSESYQASYSAPTASHMAPRANAIPNGSSTPRTSQQQQQQPRPQSTPRVQSTPKPQMGSTTSTPIHGQPQRSRAMVEIPTASQRTPSQQGMAQPQRSRSASKPTPRTLPSVKPSTPAASPLPVDFQQLLLVLAEDYIDAAHGMGSLAGFYRRSEDLQQYHTLVATGLSCIEASLTQFLLSPTAEAHLVLQYCNLVFEETTNYDEVDKWLSKTIPLCERNKLLDLKYSMQHLSIRALFATRPRLAVKTLDSLLQNVQAYKHIPWVYAFHFLRVSFSLSLGSQQDYAAALSSLRVVSELASQDDDAAVLLTCAAFEALLHLRSSANPVEETQRALATAKSFQFHPLAEELHRIWEFLDCIEVLCYLAEGNPAMAAKKTEQMATWMDKIRDRAPNVPDEGVVLVPLQAAYGSLTDNTNGIFRRAGTKDQLAFQWITRENQWALGFLLTAIATQARNAADSKCEIYIREGLKIVQSRLSGPHEADRNNAAKKSLHEAMQQSNRWNDLKWLLLTQLTVTAMCREQWDKASKVLKEARQCPKEPGTSAATNRERWEIYLQGCIHQGTGSLKEALKAFQSPLLRLHPNPTQNLPGTQTDLGILAVLNSALIESDLSGIGQVATTNIETVAPLIQNHRSKPLHAALGLLRSIRNPNDKVITKKEHITKCLKAARVVHNWQLTCVGFTIMADMFFKDVIGEQAQKSVTSTRASAEKAESTLWKSVAAGLQEHAATRHGSDVQAQKARGDATAFVGALPEILKQRFTVDG